MDNKTFSKEKRVTLSIVCIVVYLFLLNKIIHRIEIVEFARTLSNLNSIKENTSNEVLLNIKNQYILLRVAMVALSCLVAISIFYINRKNKKEEEY
ncbi:hypothetical protein [Geosporobacter ferrireducens]|uniref:Uncharacterized protein n=1 Tax=Geosporobacter ferrireducens TaxID=1424294 RepID=A0A1D8GNL9_9FIRM|nr:hypothetical protein [Geosporobacter ferrireducens]AOT72536.1 hypothetical protein Gferi_25070 [Geosporobacter ferrireducens]